jgi:uncharacterized membrane protein
MTTDTLKQINPIKVWPKTIGPIVVGLLALFWLSMVLDPLGSIVQVLRIPAALVLMLFVPGVLLTRLLNVRSDSLGVLALYSIGLSMAVTAVLTVILSLFLPIIGVNTPLSPGFVGISLTLLILVLLPLTQFSGTKSWNFSLDHLEVTPVVVFLSLLPTIAAFAAALMTRDAVPAGMFFFVGIVIFVVLVSATDEVSHKLYPIVLLTLGFSILLHRNLLTNHVIGADIQATYATAELILQNQRWSVDLASTSTSLPMVTSVPAAISTFAGIKLTTTYKVVYALLFSLVPVGMYYVGKEIFDNNIAFYGSLFFIFYHITFTVTPGKQHMSELFAVLILLSIFHQRTIDIQSKSALSLLSIGLIFTHYGMTYVLSIALIIAAVGLLVLNPVRPFNSHLSVGYPTALFTGATVWYFYASRDLIATLISIPASIANQIVTLLSTGAVPGTGGAYVGNQTGFLEQMHVGIYFILTVFITAGLAYRLIQHYSQLQQGKEPENMEYTAFALPLFVLLGLSYFAIPNLWADRIYQLVLLGLAPFAGVGYLVLTARARGFINILPNKNNTHSQWLVFAVLLCGLFALSSGYAFAMVGSAEASTFNTDANDRVFSEDERAGVQWLGTYTTTQRENPIDPESTSVLEVDRPSETQIYTDIVSSQMFRSELSENTHNLEIVILKNKWDPTIDERRIQEGYIFIRERGIDSEESNPETSPSSLSTDELNIITDSRNVVFSNGAVRIVRSSGSEEA